MKIAISSYSYLSALQDHRLTLMDIIPTAKSMGFHGVEIVNLGDPSLIKSHADALRAQSRELNMPIAAYLTSANFLAPDLDAEVKKMQQETEIAALLGAHRMRHDACWSVPSTTSFDSVLPRLIEGYRRVTEYAAGLGIHTMIENHGQFTQDARRVEAIVNGVAHKNFGWLIDIGNFLCVDEQPETSVPIALPYIFHLHAKDFHIKPHTQSAPETGWFQTRGGNHLRGAIFGHGNMDVESILSTVKRSGYDGWISLEFEGLEDCLFAIPESLKNLQKILSKEA